MTRGLTALLGILVVALGISAVWPHLRPKLPRALRGRTDRLVRVQVLNGSGEGGIASRVAAYLRDGGFQVVEVSNADRPDYFATMVVARRPDPSGAEEVSRYLGGTPMVRQAWSSERADVTVVIGSDRSRLRLE
jgi:hypothetical protein